MLIRFVASMKRLTAHQFLQAPMDRGLKSEIGKFCIGCIVRKPVFEVSDHVQHYLGCTAIEDVWRLGISDLESRGIELSL